jgi:aspartate-semialdehyde dehydrogenase
MTPKLAVVGATGAVGTVMIQCLQERGLWDEDVRLFATERSAGRVIDGHTVEALNGDASLEGIDIALFSAGGGTSKAWAPRFVEARP